MNPILELRVHASAAIQRFALTEGPQRLAQGELSAAHYAEYLKQVYYHTRENPQLQVLATAYFRGEQRGVVRRFFKHASQEIGHERLALDDLDTLGEDIREIPYLNPLPATTALIAYPFYQIRSLNPVGYLGYLFFLEALPTMSGAGYMQRLASMGVPEAAMTFLKAHSEVDHAHVRHMEYYAEQLLTTEHALQSALYAVQVTGTLYANMVAAAFAQTDAPVDYGYATTELPSYDDAPLEGFDVDEDEPESESTRTPPARTSRMRRIGAPVPAPVPIRQAGTKGKG